jgi:transcriptional regulator with XRE-family HTH domain
MSSKTANLDNLVELGKTLQLRRKELGVASQIAAASACISRVTLHRIEKGEPSVSIGAYFQVCKVLGLRLFALETNLGLQRPSKHSRLGFDPKRLDEEQILIQHYPQLKDLAWQLREDAVVTPRDALNMYERNWRFINLTTMTDKEKALIEQLKNEVGKGYLLV